jgi:hypothetical protein
LDSRAFAERGHCARRSDVHEDASVKTGARQLPDSPDIYSASSATAERHDRVCGRSHSITRRRIALRRTSGCDLTPATDLDGPVPGMSHTGAGRVASPGLGVGRSGVSITLRSITSSFPLSRRDAGRYAAKHDALTARIGASAVPRDARSASHVSRVIKVKKGPKSDPGHAVSGASLEMASVSSDRSAQDRSKAKPDEAVQTPVARLSARAASRATNAYAARAAEIGLTH